MPAPRKGNKKSSDIPDYKKLEESLARDRQQLSQLDKEQPFLPMATPSIYAFSSPELESCNQGLGAVKVGDTHRADYRKRLNEWSQEYGEIHEIGHMDAFFEAPDKDGHRQRIYFRDYPAHSVLEKHFGQERLRGKDFAMPSRFSSISKEFFVSAKGHDSVSKEMLLQTKEIIRRDWEEGTGLYKTYEEPPLTVRNPKKVSYLGDRPDTFEPYRYQRDAALGLVEKFLDGMVDRYLEDASGEDIRKIILDAPTRSGKSYMIFWALKALIQKVSGTYQGERGVFSARGSRKQEEATLTVIASAYPDIFDEFQRTIERHQHFRSFFCWISREELLLRPGIIKEKQEEGYRHIVLALSLQDLAGRQEDSELKEIHKLIEGQVDFVVGDECHFAMFSDARTYRAALSEDPDEAKRLEQGWSDGHRAQFRLSPRYGYIFASATTYSVLDRNVFDRQRDIVFVSPSEIQEETDRVNRQHRDQPLDSPFFGRPQKNYFGINIGCSPGKLFRTDRQGRFIHEDQVRAVVSAFYGIGSYENLPNIFSHDTLRAAGAGRHMLWQMPGKKSCDALESLFRELGISPEYYLLNISSARGNRWNGKSVYEIKDEIHRRRFEKTITITVARFVTGVSVPEWDSLVLANSGQSLTRRIQAYGRVETPWIEVVGDGAEQTKYCQKPNCFVFDLQPEQLYEFYNQVELHTSHLGKENGQEVVPGGKAFLLDGIEVREMTRQDVQKELDRYDGSRKIGEHTGRIDPGGELEITDDLREQITVSGSGPKAKVQIGSLEKEITSRQIETTGGKASEDTLLEEDCSQEKTATVSQEDPGQEAADRKRRQLLYKRLVLAGLLLEETDPKTLLQLLEKDKELATHLELGPSLLRALSQASENFLVADRLQRAMRTLLSRWQNASDPADAFVLLVSELETLAPDEVLTSPETAKEMVNALGLDLQKTKELLSSSQPSFIDPGAKSGALPLAVYRRLCQIINEAEGLTKERAKELCQEAGQQIVAVPTSALTYEIIKKLYELMGWNEQNIWWCEAAPRELQANWAYFIAENTADLQKIGGQQKARQEMRKWATQKNLLATISKRKADQFLSFLTKIAKAMNEQFDYTISNPPYQVSGKNNSNNSQPIYPDFIDSARLQSKEVIMIHPARFLSNAGQTKKAWNRRILADPEFLVLKDYPDSSHLFPSAGIMGGVAITSFSRGRTDGGYPNGYIRNEKLRDITEKISGKSLMDHINSGIPFDYSDLVQKEGDRAIRTNWLVRYPELFREKPSKDSYKIFGIYKNKRAVRYVKKKYVADNQLADCYKVLIPYSGKLGSMGEPIIAAPGEICTQSYIVAGNFATRKEAERLEAYCRTKFARALLSVLKTTQHNSKQTWKHVPWQDFSKDSDIDWSLPVKEIDKLLYKKYKLGKAEIEFIEENFEEVDWSKKRGGKK